MAIRILSLVLVLISSLSAQERPTFTSKAQQVLAASSPTEARSYWLFLDASATTGRTLPLTERAAKRRAKADRDGSLLDSHDYSISPSVVDQIKLSGARVRIVSRWFRAVSVDATPDQVLSVVETLPVEMVDIVQELARGPEPEALAIERVSPPADASVVELSYGSSLLQNQFVAAQKMHSAGYTGRGILIAMFDSGFNTEHPAFDSTSIVAAWDFINNDPNVTGADCSTNPQDRHGTGTFGAIGGYAPGVLIGTAFEADFILAKTEISCSGTEIKIEEDNWIAAAEWADSIGADIISSSLGYSIFQDSGSYTLADLDGNTARITIAADIAASKNILVCNSAGNERGDSEWPTIIFPADGDSVLAVGATRPDSGIAAFSSPGPSADGRIKPDIVSLGQSVFTAAAIGGYQMMSGTSLSTPLVAGAAALVLQSDSQLTAVELLQQIRQTGDRADAPDNDYGYGLMNAAHAANILRVIVPDSLALDSTLDAVIDIQTSGRTTEARTLEALNLPAGARLIDLGDGSGQIVFDSSTGLQHLNIIGVTASISAFVDTAWVVVSYSAPEGYELEAIAYPNPFVDRVTIVAGGYKDTIRSVTVLNSASEKVWERVNISAGTSDIITVEWDGRNYAGQPVAPGVYLVCVATQRETKMLKVMKVQ